MPPPGKPMIDRAQPYRFPDIDDGPSHNLWVGNLPPDTSEPELAALFGRHGALDSVTTYPARNYAFVYFKHLDSAKAARDALQGVLVRGHPIKIEFARPAKPGKNLWIGGISLSVTKEQLEDEFSKFGKIEDYKFFRERNSALVNYYKIDDAINALKSMNGKRVGGEQIRVDYLRSQPIRRDLSDHYDGRDVHFSNIRGMEPPETSWMPPDLMRNFPEDFHHRRKSYPPPGIQRDHPSSKILWVGYPPSLQIDEQMLHNAMILFGEIEQIKSFPSRHCSFVEFRSVDEARRAKEGLEGRLFNDPRIQLLFSNGDFAPSMDNLPLIPFPGPRGPRPDMLFGEQPLGHIEYFGPGHPMAPGSFPGTLPPINLSGSSMLGRSFAPQGFDPLYGGPEFLNDAMGPVHNFPEGSASHPMATNSRRLSPAGILSPAPGMQPPMRPLPGMWDGLDIRNPKRSRIDGPPIDESSLHARRMDSQGIGDAHAFRQPDKGAARPDHRSPIGSKRSAVGFPDHVEQYGAPSRDHYWRGIIAKGGTPVCHARCVPLGKGIESPLPGIINCSAKTGLDALTKHYAEAKGFDIVFFLPDSEDDFASYTEFLHYLGQNNRAGVAKLDDGTTLFLVPPSDFLAKVLNVSGPERLYGVVLKMLQQPMSAVLHTPHQTVLPDSHYADGGQPASQSGYSLPLQYEGRTLQMEYNNVLPGESASINTIGRHSLGGDESQPVQSVPSDYVSKPVTLAPVEVSLTPDLVATLASLIPNNAQPSTPGNTQFLSTSFVRPVSTPLPVASDKGMPPPMWSQEPQASAISGPHEQINHPSLMVGHQFENQMMDMSQLPSYTNIANVSDSSVHVQGGTQVLGNVPSSQQLASITSRPFDSYSISSQAAQGQFFASQTNQQNQFSAAFTSNTHHGISQTTEVSVTGLQQTNSTTSSQVQNANVLQHQIVSPLAPDKMNISLSTQLQQLQNALSGAAQGSSESEADKNQRYQSTLQFAANLLVQIQQQQQQTGSQTAQGSGNQQ